MSVIETMRSDRLLDKCFVFLCLTVMQLSIVESFTMRSNLRIHVSILASRDLKASSTHCPSQDLGNQQICVLVKQVSTDVHFLSI
jgi:hypothetical protein